MQVQRLIIGLLFKKLAAVNRRGGWGGKASVCTQSDALSGTFFRGGGWGVNGNSKRGNTITWFPETIWKLFNQQCREIWIVN